MIYNQVLDIVILSAHPDDEVLGMGGTIKKLAQKQYSIHLGIISEGATAQYSDKKMIKVRKEACKKAGKVLGIKTFDFFELPDMRLNEVSHLEINQKIEKMILKYNPSVVYTTPKNDLNKDHQIVFESTLVATRPLTSNVKQVLCYEIPGITKFPFQPTIYENIEKQFTYKIKALNEYKTEIKEFPHPRSIEAIESLSVYRGMESGFVKAESFELIRNIIK